MSDASKPKLNYINYFRALAIITIVLGHSVCWGDKSGAIYELNSYLLKGGTFSFIFIAGFLFQYLSYKFKYLTYLKKKFFNVVLPYLFCITPAIITFYLTNNNPKIPIESMHGVIKLISSYLFGMVFNNPMWFVGMIVIFFILAPVFIFLKKHKNLWAIILIISLLSTIFLKRPSVGYAIYHLENFKISTIWFEYLKLYFTSFLFFSSLYLLGMQTCTTLDKHLLTVKKYIKPALIVLCFIYFLIPVFYTTSQAHNLGHILAMFIYLGFCILFEDKVQKSPVIDKILNTIANYSFGIFFIHQYFINPLMFHSLYDTFIPPVLEIQQDTFQSCINSYSVFIISILGSLFVLFVIKTILNKLGIKNTRKFIGV